MIRMNPFSGSIPYSLTRIHSGNLVLNQTSTYNPLGKENNQQKIFQTIL